MQAMKNSTALTAPLTGAVIVLAIIVFKQHKENAELKKHIVKAGGVLSGIANGELSPDELKAILKKSGL